MGVRFLLCPAVACTAHVHEGLDGTCISAQRKKQERLMGFPFEHRAPLKRVRLVEIDGPLVMTEIGELQKQILEEIRVELPWEVQ
jgi:hypothetical protein